MLYSTISAERKGRYLLVVFAGSVFALFSIIIKMFLSSQPIIGVPSYELNVLTIFSPVWGMLRKFRYVQIFL